jgi:hypothetical protein
LLTVWKIDEAPLPPPHTSDPQQKAFMSSLVIVEVSKIQSDTPLQLGSLKTPIIMKLAAVRDWDAQQNGASGVGYVAAAMLWSFETCDSSREGARTISSDRVSGGRQVVAELWNFGHLSVVLRLAGCDSIADSGKLLDSCRVCGGDDSTWSACNGKVALSSLTAALEPQPVNLRACSGHGKCARESCS